MVVSEGVGHDSVLDVDPSAVAIGGRLSTPWGPGQWGLHRGFEAALFADFIGTAHNIELSAGIAVATRCADDNIVLMRSVKGLDLPK